MSEIEVKVLKMPDRIWADRDEETNEKRWFSCKGMGVEYVRADFDARIGSAIVSTPPAAAVTGGQAIRAHAHLIRCFADDINERNWDDKRLYIMRQVDHLVGELAAPSPVGDRDALIERLCQSPIIEALTPTNSNWEACEVAQDRYDLMKRLIRTALSLPENAEDRSNA